MNKLLSKGNNTIATILLETFVQTKVLLKPHMHCSYTYKALIPTTSKLYKLDRVDQIIGSLNIFIVTQLVILEMVDILSCFSDHPRLKPINFHVALLSFWLEELFKLVKVKRLLLLFVCKFLAVLFQIHTKILLGPTSVDYCRKQLCHVVVIIIVFFILIPRFKRGRKYINFLKCR